MGGGGGGGPLHLIYDGTLIVHFSFALFRVLGTSRNVCLVLAFFMLTLKLRRNKPLVKKQVLHRQTQQILT